MKATSKSDVIERLRASEGEIRRFGVRKIGLFGSFARNEATSDSDVDVLVEFEANQKTFDHFMGLVSLLEKLLQRPVEVVTPEALSPHIGPRILESVEYVTVTR